MMTPLAPWAALCEELAATTKKLEKRALMAAWLRSVPTPDAAHAALWLAGAPFPETAAAQLGVGGSSLWQVVAELTRAPEAAMREAYRRHGDMGSAAFDLLRAPAAAGSPLTIAEVADLFPQLAAARGPVQKRPLLHALLARATPLEAKYLIKLILGDMRIGVKQAQVEEAIAEATGRPLADLRRAVMLEGDLGQALHMAAADTLAQARMRLFHPLGFMLASPVDSVAAAMDRFAEEVREEARGEGGAEPLLAGDPPPVPLAKAQVEDKFDGIRCQLHCGDPSAPGRVALFSRSRDDMTASFPELVEAFAAVPVPLILDGEILAWQPAAEETASRALPFSSLQNRIGRKRVTPEMRRQTPVVFMAFDLLYHGAAPQAGTEPSSGEAPLPGETLYLDRPLTERRAALEALHAAYQDGTVLCSAPPPAPSSQGGLFGEAASPPSDAGFARFVLATVTQLASADQLEQAYVDARARGNEGVMLKAAASLYQPGRRGLAWLKLKRELATLDVVVTAAEYGHGRRAGVLSDYTFAVRDGDTLKNVGKAYSGLTDAEIAGLSAYFHEHTLEERGHVRTVEPTLVLEVAFNNLMRSDRHASGFAMRFPRILRIRGDKSPAEIDTLARVEELYHQQPDRPVES